MLWFIADCSYLGSHYLHPYHILHPNPYLFRFQKWTSPTNPQICPSKFKIFDIHDFRENWENFRRFWMIIWLNFLTMFIQEHFSVLRRLTYPDADVFIICFSIIDPYSFKRVQTKWVKELSEYCPNTPVVLVGTKYDQRNNINTKILLNKHGLQPVSSEQGEQVARKIGAKQVKIKNYTPYSPWFHPNFILTRYQRSSETQMALYG